MYARWDLSSFLAKIFFNNGLATRDPIIFKSLIRIPLYVHIYHVLPILFNQRPRFRVEIHTSFNSWFSFFVSPSRSPNREKFRQFVRRGSSSVIETKHASSCDQHARASLLFTQITSMKRYNLSLQTNHEFILPQRGDPSNNWSVFDRFIPDNDLLFLKTWRDDRWLMGEDSKLRRFVKEEKSSERLWEKYQKSAWIVKIDVMLFSLIEIFECSWICSCRFFFFFFSRDSVLRSFRD